MDLQTPIAALSRVGKTTAKKFTKLGLETVQDLLFYYPFRYDDFSRILRIADLIPGQNITIKGKVELIANKRSPAKRKIITEALVADESGSVKVIWFNQPFLTKLLKSGDTIYLAGKADYDHYGLQLNNPSYEKINKWTEGTTHTGRLVPIYPSTENLTQKQIRYLVRLALPQAKSVRDWLPESVKKELNLCDLPYALEQIHFPENKDRLARSEHRLKFDELFLIQLRNQYLKKELQKYQAPIIKFKLTETKKLLSGLPFALTNAQKKASWEIIKDLAKPKPMNRLLDGDVGSGKTLVAAMAMLNAAINGYQAVLMAPTEILAKQHYETFSNLLKSFNISVGLLTGNDAAKNASAMAGQVKRKAKSEKTAAMAGQAKTKNKNNILKQISDGEIDIVIGTHALISSSVKNSHGGSAVAPSPNAINSNGQQPATAAIKSEGGQKKVKFKNLGLVIVDEQHRFGVEQRAALTSRTIADFAPTSTDPAPNNTIKLLYEELTYKIRGAVFNVKKQLGLGHKEIIYQKALEKEFRKIKLIFEKEAIIDIAYDEEKIGTYRPDFIIENKIILEIKSLPSMGKYEKQQVWHYLKGSDYKLALLVNFGRDDVKIERIIHASSASSPRQSALMPHFLSMTATPIPRSLAMALYGDLDLSLIDEMPKERKKVMTKIVSPLNRQKAYDFIRKEIRNGRQAFVVCPLIDESDKLGVKSAKAEYEKLSETVFPDLKIGLLHGKMKAEEKESVMQDLLADKIKILVSTSVIEVGVNVPNASVMVIEGAERFGLAQLYQFKGRVGRSRYQSYCLLFTENESVKTSQRLEALVNAKNGFDLAEKDLELRGPGEVFGDRQSGFLSELKIAKLTDYLIIKQAKEQAEKILNQDPELENYHLLKEKLDYSQKNIHLE